MLTSFVNKCFHIIHICRINNICPHKTDDKRYSTHYKVITYSGMIIEFVYGNKSERLV